jgi:hypothetical protein
MTIYDDAIYYTLTNIYDVDDATRRSFENRKSSNQMIVFGLFGVTAAAELPPIAYE